MSDLAALASKLYGDAASPPKVVPTAKRVRGVLGGRWIFDTTQAKLVWEHQYFPQYWVPRHAFDDAVVQFEADKPVSGIDSSTAKLSVAAKKGQAATTVSVLVVPDSFDSELAGLVKVDFHALDAWYEEDAQVLYHPKDPYHRVDIIPSSRTVRVELDGVVLAECTSGVMSLWETNLPARWYIPRTSVVDWSVFSESPTHTGCPYKGQASYFSATVNDKEYKDVVWWYPQPTLESVTIAGMLCFYPDKVDVYVDGEPVAKLGMPKPPAATNGTNGTKQSS